MFCVAYVLALIIAFAPPIPGGADLLYCPGLSAGLTFCGFADLLYLFVFARAFTFAAFNPFAIAGRLSKLIRLRFSTCQFFRHVGAV